jgi:hypothetical protein
MSTIVTRSGKGSPLTHVEVDANFTNLNTDKIQSGNTVAALTITSASVVDLAVTGITSFDGAQGTAGQVLTSAGTGATPTWTTPTTGTVTSVTGTAPVVSSGGNTPAISMAAATGSVNGYLTSTDWTTFNGKANAFTYTSNYIPYGQGTTTPAQSANLTFNGTTLVANDITDSSLTATRVTYAGTSGNLVDSANLTFSGTTLTTTGISTSNNLTFTGTGNRITGDLTNATFANRVAFQSSTTNGSTNLTVIPNGTSTTSAINLEGDSAATNGAVAQLVNAGGTEVRLNSGIRGTGTYVPMTFFTGGSEKMRIDTSGNVGIGISAPAFKLDVRTSVDAVQMYASNGTVQQAVGYCSAGQAISGAITNHPYILLTNNVERMRINAGAPILCLSGGNTSATGTGIAFPATQSASSDANTLDDYEEGTWTPADASGAGLTFTSVTARYTKIGNVVYINARLTYPTTADVSQAKISGLPFAPAVCANILFGGNAASVNALNAGQGVADAASTTMFLIAQNNTSKTNANLSTLILGFSGSYLV